MKKILAIFTALVLAATFLVSCGGDGEKIDFSELVLGGLLPEPKSDVGQVFSDSEKDLDVHIHKTSKSDYREYVDSCKGLGFTFESSQADSMYVAYNEEGYELHIYYYESDEKLDVSLRAPMEMDKYRWPDSEIAGIIPLPSSGIGKIDLETSDKFAIYVGDTSIDDYDAYVDECMDGGFSIDYSKSDKSFKAYNENGYELLVTYNGGNVMYISISAPEDEGDPAPQAAPTPDAAVTSEPDSGSEADIDNNSETGGADEEAPVSSGIRQEFKQAMDSYEAFFDEYIAFMREYAESDNALGMMVEYGRFMSQYAETMAALEAMGEEELSTEEMVYYTEVMARISTKLLSIS